MKKIAIVIAIIIYGSLSSFAQKGASYVVDEKSSITDRIVKGGGFGITGNRNATIISISPFIGYMISTRLSAGLGGSYQYYKSNRFEDNQYGGFLYTRMNLIKNFYAYTDYSFVNQTDYRDTNSRITIDRLTPGLGYSMPIGAQSSFNMGIAYDLLYEKNGRYYGTPWVYSFYLSI